MIWLIGSVALAEAEAPDAEAPTIESPEPAQNDSWIWESGSEAIEGEVTFLYRYICVDGDRGRFREDNWITDGSTGALDWLSLGSTGPDENGYEWQLEARALYDYDYRLSFLISKQDSHYFTFESSILRRYYDGSNEFWTAPLKSLADRDDNDLFVDRINYNLEFGLTPPDRPNLVFGWHRLIKDGKSVSLHGSEGEDAGGVTRRSIPDILNQKGVTDTVYGELSHTIADRYNVRARQEWERYRDKQYGPLMREFDAAGVLTDNDRFHEDLGWTNWRTQVMFDTFVDDQTYVTASYMYDQLESAFGWLLSCVGTPDFGHALGY